LVKVTLNYRIVEKTSPVETNKNIPVEHQNVPESHRGLHEFLYSGDDEHAATEVTAVAVSENDGTEVVSMEAWSESDQNAKVAGVYAVLDQEHRTQYVGYSRNVLLSLNSHVAQLGKSMCAFVRVQAFKYPKRTEMENLRDAWIKELESIPPGNGEDSGMWASTVGEAARVAMSPTERNAYEEKKLKLRKAIADTTLSREPEAMDASDAERRQKLESAVKNDDWSSIINES
jgi:hypothetical protein